MKGTQTDRNCWRAKYMESEEESSAEKGMNMNDH
jgi:hypothetical protein